MMDGNCGNLYLSDTGITSLPENLTVGGSLYLRGTPITSKNANKLHNGDYVEGRYLYADGILTHIKTHKTISGYTLFVGKIPGKNVVFDGKNYEYRAKYNKYKEERRMAERKNKFGAQIGLFP